MIMFNSFALWAVVTAIAFVFGFTYLTYLGLREKDFPKIPENKED